MTINEINGHYTMERRNLSDAHRKSLEDRLKEIHYNGLVRRKKDGKFGWLRVVYEDFCYTVKFYPRTKSGDESRVPSGYSWDIENDYESADTE